MARWFLVWTIAVFLCSAMGCSQAGTSCHGQGYSSPRALLEAYVEALDDPDESKLRDCFLATTEKMQRVREDLVKATSGARRSYKVLSRLPDAPSEVFLVSDAALRAFREHVLNERLVVTGDRCTYSGNGGAYPVTALCRTCHGWQFDLAQGLAHPHGNMLTAEGFHSLAIWSRRIDPVLDAVERGEIRTYAQYQGALEQRKEER